MCEIPFVHGKNVTPTILIFGLYKIGRTYRKLKIAILTEVVLTPILKSIRRPRRAASRRPARHPDHGPELFWQVSLIIVKVTTRVIKKNLDSKPNP